jgi:hypothetical protein
MYFCDIVMSTAEKIMGTKYLKLFAIYLTTSNMQIEMYKQDKD